MPGMVERIADRVGDRPVYVSVDIDVLDPAHAPGTGTPEAGGLTSRELLATLRSLRRAEPRRRRHRGGGARLRSRADHRHRRRPRRLRAAVRAGRPVSELRGAVPPGLRSEGACDRATREGGAVKGEWEGGRGPASEREMSDCFVLSTGPRVRRPGGESRARRRRGAARRAAGRRRGRPARAGLERLRLPQPGRGRGQRRGRRRPDGEPVGPAGRRAPDRHRGRLLRETAATSCSTAPR